MTTARQPKGVPVGGQFAKTARAEADVCLGAPPRIIRHRHTNAVSYGFRDPARVERAREELTATHTDFGVAQARLVHAYQRTGLSARLRPGEVARALSAIQTAKRRAYGALTDLADELGMSSSRSFAPDARAHQVAAFRAEVGPLPTPAEVEREIADARAEMVKLQATAQRSPHDRAARTALTAGQVRMEVARLQQEALLEQP